MQLSELFVSHKQVSPVTFDKDEPSIPQPIYLNLDRAKKVTSENSTSNDTSEEDMSSWKVEMDSWKEGYEPGWSVKSLEPEKSSPSDVLANYRTNPGYDQFKTELDLFIKNNPNYSGIKDSLDYLAALESSYNLGAKNGSGSSALGWFQFLDTTRRTYNKQSRANFAKDPQAQLMVAAQHYTKLQDMVRKKGGDPNDFVTMYGAWWRPQSAFAYIKDKNYDYTTKYNEKFSDVIGRAKALFN